MFNGRQIPTIPVPTPSRLGSADLEAIRGVLKDELEDVRGALVEEMKSIAANETQRLVRRLDAGVLRPKKGEDAAAGPASKTSGFSFFGCAGATGYTIDPKDTRRRARGPPNPTPANSRLEALRQKAPLPLGTPEKAQDVRSYEDGTLGFANRFVATRKQAEKPKQVEEKEAIKIPVHEGAFADFLNKHQRNLAVKPHTVEDDYHNSGIFQVIARHHHFINATLGVIALNAIYIGVEADYNTEPTIATKDRFFQVCDLFFCIYFTTEIIIRFLAFRNKISCVHDGWFKFDTFLVVLMLVETFGMPVILEYMGQTIPMAPLRLFRLLRLSRMARLLRKLPELMTMITAMRLACRAVIASLVIVLILLYVFGIIMNMAVGSESKVDTEFGTIPKCMWTLMIDGTLMDSPGLVMRKLLNLKTVEGVIAIGIFNLFLLLSALTVLNMLIGVLCEVVSAVGEKEKEDFAVNLMQETILNEILVYDDGDGFISEDELESILSDQQTVQVFRSLDVDVPYLMELNKMVYSDQGTKVPIEGLMDLILMCRGDLSTTVGNQSKGQALIRWTVQQECDRLSSLIEAIATELVIELPENPRYQRSLEERLADIQGPHMRNGNGWSI